MSNRLARLVLGLVRQRYDLKHGVEALVEQGKVPEMDAAVIDYLGDLATAEILEGGSGEKTRKVTDRSARGEVTGFSSQMDGESIEGSRVGKYSRHRDISDIMRRK